MRNIAGWSDRHPRTARWLMATALTLLILSALFVALLSITNWNFARGAVAKIISSQVDRPVTIGAIRADLLSSQPNVTLDQLVIGNPPEMQADDFATVEKLLVAIELRELFKANLVLATLEVTNPTVNVISRADGRDNFHLADSDAPAAGSSQRESARPPKIPAIRNFVVSGGVLRVQDEIRKLRFDGKVEANEQADSSASGAFRLRGNGTLNGEPFALAFAGGPLANLRLDQPYEFTADVRAGKTQAIARGVFTEPFDFARLTATLDIKGENMAHLYHLTGLALPFTPPYRVKGELQSSDQKISVRQLNGKMGNSDLQGDIAVDLNAERPTLIARLRSKSLDLADLSPAFGKGVAVDPETGGALDSVAPGDLPPDKIFPTYRFEFDRLRTMDADVKLRADSIQARAIPVERVDIHLKLANAALTLNPIVFTLPQGSIAGSIHINARNETAKSTVDLRINEVNLAQFKGEGEPPLDGALQARMQFTGTGNSVHEVAASANGRVSAVLPQGEIRQALAELTGVNLARGLGLLLTKNETKIAVRCGVASLRLEQGNAVVEQLVVDTETVAIEGKGSVNLAEETLDLELDGKPKKIRLARLDAPVTLEGPLRKPALGVDKSETAKQVGIAGAIGALLAPLTAALAFIDPGLEKDKNCAALIAATEQAQPQAPSNQAPSK